MSLSDEYPATVCTESTDGNRDDDLKLEWRECRRNENTGAEMIHRSDDLRRKPTYTAQTTHANARWSRHTHTHTRLTALYPELPRWAGTIKVKTNLDFTGARDSEWQRHRLGHMQVCTSLQTDNHASTPPLSFLQARCPSCRPTNSVKARKGF